MTTPNSTTHSLNEPIQAVIFDLDGVLMDSEWMAFQVWREYVEQCGSKLDDAVYPHIIGMSAEETAEYIREASGASFDTRESCDWAWDRLSERMKGTLDPIPGAVELVRDLSARELPLAIASNSPRHYIDNALRGLGLSGYFPVRVGIDQVAQGKPAPDVYLRAADLLRIDPARCLAVEDSKVGVQAAASAGMRVLAIPAHDPNGSMPGAWQIFTSMREAHQAIKAALG